MTRLLSLLIFLGAALWGGIVPIAHSEQEAPSAAPAGDTIVLKQLAVRTLDSSLPERLAMLPAQHLRTPRSFKQFSASTDFQIADASAHRLWAVYIASFAHGGDVSINGVHIGQVATSTPETTVWHTRPFLFTVPLGVLHNGTNRFELRWGARESLTLLSVMAIGPADVLEPVYRSRFFWQNTMAEVALVHALVIAAILLGIYSTRRHQVNYLSLGVGALGFSVIMLTYMLPPMPGWFYPLWRAIHIGGIGMFTAGAWLFLIREAQPENRWFPVLCMAWSAIGPAVYLVHFALTDITFYKWFETAWGGISGVIGLYPVCLLALALWRRWAWREFIFVFATLCAIAMGVADILLQGTARSHLGSTGYGLQMVSPLWFTALTGVLVLDFAKSLRQEDEQRKHMATELDRQRHDLAELHAVSQQYEREQAALHERQRIMQDIHDGLGSQLISSLALSERGHLSAGQTSLLLRDCIDDLRLAIDALSGDEDQFIVAAGNLRFRMAPRLAAAGIQLQWDAKTWTNDAAVSTTQTLPILRIMQEAFTNTLKHANAKTLSVTLRSTDREINVVIKDDGHGFDSASTSIGKGLHGMEKRARSIGAQLRVTSMPLTCAPVQPDFTTCISLKLSVSKPEEETHTRGV